MELKPGAKLGPYEILSPIGAGGMGQVWKARDTRLGRTVAIKVSDAKFSERFAQEARAIAALNHTNICTLYDVGPDYLVMEYVEGAEIKGPLPLGQALALAIQLAGALEAAHRKGITHRDLKPANILTTKSGVKVLDFGLAKVAQTKEAAANDETVTRALTQEGSIVGTLQYMAPEQLQGKETDARADIFSFGCVLHEMLTGKRAFDGANAASVIAAVMEREAPSVGGVAPAPLDWALRRCLAKDPDERWQSAGDLKAELLWIAGGGTEVPRQAEARPTWVPWIAAALLGLALASLAVVHLREKPAELPVVRVTIALPSKSRLALLQGGPTPALVSPDGRRIVFSATGPDGQIQLWVRALDALAAQPLSGTDGAIPWFWSPDSRSVGFSADDKLKKIDVVGGPPLTLADAPVMRGGAWNKDGVIVFAPSTSGPLMRVSAAGGAATPVTRLDASRGEGTHRLPWFLPDGRHFLFSGGTQASGHLTVRIGSLDSLENKVLLEANSEATYAQGYLLFLRESTLMAQPFDAKRLVLAGEAAPLAEQVQRSTTTNYALFSASDTGLLAYQNGLGSGSLRLTWMDRTGKRLSTVGDPANLSRMQLSPDRKSAAVAVTEGNNNDIWIYDLARSLRTRFTFDPASEFQAVWSPDGRAIVFCSNRKGHYDLYRKSADGTGAEELLYADGLEKFPAGLSPDGKFLLYYSSGGPTGYDLWVLPLAAGSKPFPLLQTPFNELIPQLSPDGKWVAYQSNESGRQEIYVIPFRPEGGPPGGKRQISTAGGTDSRWRRDGRELFYIGPDGKFMAAEVSAKAGTFEVGQVRALFSGMFSGAGFLYDAAPDGQSFLAVLAPEQTADAQPITVVQNWTAELKK